ncbi:MAG TPA: VWA domain-containing protein, partial [Vicinamibacterales bacterium]|nr:VWA domain-containing protein [Vicinamibacterales bacterium]
LMFFEPRTQSSIRHRRLRYLALLSLRMALLVLLALAFANPFVNRPAASVPSEKLVLLVVDDSFSMRAGTRLEDAKREALSVIGARRSSERIQVMSLDAQLHPLTQPTRDSATARAAVESIRPTDSRGSYGELARAVRLMTDTEHGPIELHLVSDMQRSSMAPSFSEMVFPGSVTLTLHPVVKSAVPNWTVESVTAPAQLWGPAKDAKPTHVQAVIAGYGTPAATRKASLIVNGKTTATQDVQVPAGGRATVEFASLDVPYGFSRCEVRIDASDGFPGDDGYVFAVERSDPQRVLFLHGTSDSRSPLYYSDALGASAESAFALQSVSLDQATNLALSKYAFVILSNIAALPSSFESDLLKYVRGGGSLFVAIGTSAAGRSRIPVSGDTIQTVHDYSREAARGRERYISVSETDLSHAAIGKAGSLTGVKFFYSVGIDPANSRVIARLSDRTPLLLDKKVGEGRVLVFASGFDNLTNDFPLHPAFVAFVDETARYLSGAERHTGARLVDAFLELRTAQDQGADRALGVEVVDPDGHRPLSLTEAATTQSFRLTQAGFYQVRLANGRQEIVGVNPDRRESNLEVMADDVVAAWRGKDQGNKPAAPAVLAGQQSQQQEPVSLWWYIMMLALVAALSESWLGSRYLGTPREES